MEWQRLLNEGRFRTSSSKDEYRQGLRTINP